MNLLSVTTENNLEQLAADVRANSNTEWHASKWGARLTSGGSFNLSEDRLLIIGTKTQQEIPYLSIESAVAKRGLIWSSIRIRSAGQNTTITVTGMGHQHAVEAAEVLRKALTLANVQAFARHRSQAKEIEEHIHSVLDAPFWIAKSQVSEMCTFLRLRTKENLQDWPVYAKEAGALDYLSGEEVRTLQLINDPQSTIKERVDSHNQRFLREELIARGSFFDTIEKNPLTDEQRVAAITFDDNVLTIAAAGSGKTSTLVAKAGYAITAGIAEPAQILLLAFNKDAADELKERVQQYLSKHISNASDIAVSTFHAFGLSVIGEATGKKPRVAPWIDQGKDLEALAGIVDELKSDKKFFRNWTFFRSIYARSLPEIGEDEEPEWWDPDTKARGFKTLRGETVKSKEELMIANWLANNGIDYRYEARYEHRTATAQHAQYHPDFYYPEVELYHEHFALDEFGRAPAEFADYEEGVAWKRNLHAENETLLIETTSHTIRQADGLEKLETQLKDHGVVFDRRPLAEHQLETIGDEASLINLIRTFLIHVKSNHIDISELRLRSQQGRLGSRPHPGRENLFLDLFERIWCRWDEKLRKGNYVDFEDMLSKAAHHLVDGSFRSPYTLVMADEFQDTSIVRGKILKALTSPSGSKLFVVGDDWQAINRFAGADISLMNDFEANFGPSATVKLTKTFRCPQKISDLAASFISKNPSQIVKSVETTNQRTEDSVLCYAVGENQDLDSLVERHIRQLHQKPGSSGSGKKTVMVLGRYWSDKPQNLSKWKTEFKDRLDIGFSTIHAAKGLEGDYVFLVNLRGGRMGFPSEIEDDPLLQLAMPTSEAHPHAEERRLFYVALTRAKEMTILYTQSERESEFLIELQRDGLIDIRRQEGPLSVETCPECHRGSIVVKRNRKRGNEFLGCSRFPRCEYTRTIENAE